MHFQRDSSKLTFRATIKSGRLFICSLAAALASAVFMLANVPLAHPLQCRETADTFGTALLLQGKNPFSLEQPPDYFYSYGIVHSLLTYPLARVFGATFLVHRVIACTCLMLACAVLYWGMRVTRVPRLLAFCGALLLFDHLVFSFAITAKPDSVGLLFLLLSVVIPLARDFRWDGIALGILFSLLGLYTKPYFVAGGPLLILYLFLFRSKGAGLAAGVLFAGLLVATLAAVNALLPTYFTDVFYDQRNIAEFSLKHLGIMLLEYAVLGWALVLVLGWRFWSEFLAPGALRDLVPRWDFLRLSDPHTPSRSGNRCRSYAGNSSNCRLRKVSPSAARPSSTRDLFSASQPPFLPSTVVRSSSA